MLYNFNKQFNQVSNKCYVRIFKKDSRNQAGKNLRLLIVVQELEETLADHQKSDNAVLLRSNHEVLQILHITVSYRHSFSKLMSMNRFKKWHGDQSTVIK